jgi:hypothetical protein
MEIFSESALPGAAGNDRLTVYGLFEIFVEW